MIDVRFFLQHPLDVICGGSLRLDIVRSILSWIEMKLSFIFLSQKNIYAILFKKIMVKWNI